MTTEGFFLDSSDIFRESPCRGIGGNIAKKLKRKRYFFVVLSVYFLFYISLQFLRFVCIHNIHKQNYHIITPESMFLSSIDFSMIMGGWFESGMIV